MGITVFQEIESLDVLINIAATLCVTTLITRVSEWREAALDTHI